MPSDPTLRVQSVGSATVKAVSEVPGHWRSRTCRTAKRNVGSVSGCSLDLRVGTRDDGVRQVQPLGFECVLSTEGWRGVEELLEPFSEPDSSGFQWLTTGGGTSLLISANGQW
jgi:hypothetical protein